jgi:hypothetical protein
MPTIKERLASASRVQLEYRLALTPEQIATPHCRWFHKWDRVDDDTPLGGLYAYFQCRKCHDRKSKQLFCGGYSCPDVYWLRGKERGYLISFIPTKKSPVSVSGRG